MNLITLKQLFLSLWIAGILCTQISALALPEEAPSNPDTTKKAYQDKLNSLASSLDLLEERVRELSLGKSRQPEKPPSPAPTPPTPPPASATPEPEYLESVELPLVAGTDDAIIHQEVLIPKPENKYYITLSSNLNFASDTKISTISGIGHLDSEVGYGFEAEFGRSFSFFDLGFAFSYDRHEFEDLVIGINSLGGEGYNTAYRLLLKPGINLDFNDRVGIKTGADLGVISRHSTFSVPSIGFEQSNDEISFVWGLRLSLIAKLNENHSLFIGYAYADYPEVERFNDVSMSSLEAGYTGRF